MKVIKFGAVWCAPCKAMQPVIDQLKKEIGDKVTFVEVDVDKEPSLCNQYSVNGLPAIVITDDKGQAQQKLMGTQSRQEIISALRMCGVNL